MQTRRLVSILFILFIVIGATSMAGRVAAFAWDSPTRAEGAFQRGEARIEAELLIDPRPSEHAQRVGVRFRIDPGWHLYWRNSGESGLPSRLGFHVESGGESVPATGKLAWPAPSLFREAEGSIATYGYADEVLISTQLARPPSGTEASATRVGVEIDVLVCDDECIPARFELVRSLSSPTPGVDPAAEGDSAAVAASFDRAARLVPRSFSESELREAGWTLSLNSTSLSAPSTVAAQGEVFQAQLRLACEDCDYRAGRFFPYESDAISVEASAGDLERVAPGHFALAVRGEVWEAGAPELAGVLVLTDTAGSVTALEVQLPLALAPELAPAAAMSDEASVSWVAWLEALAFALLGGLILNLMPCVLPVLAIKACSVAEMAERSRRELLGHGLSYTGGVLLSMLALGTVVVLLRGAGSSVGWGFQFQEPLFVAVVSTVVVAFALNLFGVFEIELGTGALGNVGAQREGWQRSFFEGLLAVVLATPCSAPFLGTAVGFAFASSAPVILSIFLAIGLGLAAPYLAISAIPGLARLLPRPGAWMLQLRVGLGFALLATTLWLLWVVGRSAGADSIIALAGFLLTFAFCLWAYGLFQRSEKVLLRRFAALGVLVFAFAGLDTVSLERTETSGGAAEQSWSRPFESSAIDSALVLGNPVFVYFTADWCITCKVNEKGVLQDSGIRERVRSLGFQVFRGDWTQRDESIRKELARFGRAGVPLYVIYDPDDPTNPRILPELLTVRVLDEALIAAAPSAGSELP